MAVTMYLLFLHVSGNGPKKKNYNFYTVLLDYREHSCFYLNIDTYQINANLTPNLAWNWNGVKFRFLSFQFCVDPLTHITSSAVLVDIFVQSFPPVRLSDL